jgi:hypothetical protein
VVIKFDLSKIPSNANIVSAYYYMYYTTGDFVKPHPEDRCSLFTMTKPWDADAICWKSATKNVEWLDLDPDTKHPNGLDTNGYPGGGDHSKGIIAIFDPPQQDSAWDSYKVTNTMKDFINNSKPFYGFYAKAWFGNTSRNYVSSHDSNIVLRPKLIIKYVGTGIISNNNSTKDQWNILINQSGKNLNVLIPFTGAYTFSVTDLRGKTIFVSKGFNKQWHSVPTRNIPKGVNVFSVVNKGNTVAKRFIIE